MGSTRILYNREASVKEGRYATIIKISSLLVITEQTEKAVGVSPEAKAIIRSLQAAGFLGFINRSIVICKSLFELQEGKKIRKDHNTPTISKVLKL